MLRCAGDQSSRLELSCRTLPLASLAAPEAEPTAWSVAPLALPDTSSAAPWALPASSWGLGSWLRSGAAFCACNTSEGEIAASSDCELRQVTGAVEGTCRKSEPPKAAHTGHNHGASDSNALAVAVHSSRLELSCRTLPLASLAAPEAEPTAWSVAPLALPDTSSAAPWALPASSWGLGSWLRLGTAFCACTPACSLTLRCGVCC